MFKKIILVLFIAIKVQASTRPVGVDCRSDSAKRAKLNSGNVVSAPFVQRVLGEVARGRENNAQDDAGEVAHSRFVQRVLGEVARGRENNLQGDFFERTDFYQERGSETAPSLIDRARKRKECAERLNQKYQRPRKYRKSIAS